MTGKSDLDVSGNRSSASPGKRATSGSGQGASKGPRSGGGSGKGPGNGPGKGPRKANGGGKHRRLKTFLKWFAVAALVGILVVIGIFYFAYKNTTIPDANKAFEAQSTFVYYSGIQNGDWSYAAAAGLIKGVISVILVLGANKLAHLFGEAGVYQKS